MCWPLRGPAFGAPIMKRLLATLALLTVAAAAAFAQPASSPTGKTARAIFAGGCFWCTEADFDKVPGVISTTSGYIGGKIANPTYEQVSAGMHRPRRGGRGRLRSRRRSATRSCSTCSGATHDPLAKDRQFCDRGEQYRAGVFYHDDEQRKLAEAVEAGRAGEVRAAPGAHRDHQGRHRSTRPRTITRTITRRIRSATSSTATTAAAISAWRSCGASPTRAVEPRHARALRHRTEIDRDRDHDRAGPGWSAARASRCWPVCGGANDDGVRAGDVRDRQERRRMAAPAQARRLQGAAPARHRAAVFQPAQRTRSARARSPAPVASCRCFRRRPSSKAAPAGRASTGRCRTRSAPRATAR